MNKVPPTSTHAVVPKMRGYLHLVSAPMSLIAGIPLLVFAPTTELRIATAVFIASAINLFSVSATYHIGKWSVGVKKTLRRIDHSNIFVIIAGTYTPLAVALLSPDDARVLLSAVWIAAAAGVLLSALWPHAPRWVSVPLYLAMGWVSVLYIPAMTSTGGLFVVGLIALGGILYSCGAIVYALKKPNISITWFGFHELFHAFTVAAFIAHFAAITLALNVVR